MAATATDNNKQQQTKREMTTVTIGGKEYKMAANAGAMVCVEMFNEGVQKEHGVRMTLGNILACLYGGDMNCGLTIEDLMTQIDSMEKFNELKDAMEAEFARFAKTNEPMNEDEPEGN